MEVGSELAVMGPCTAIPIVLATCGQLNGCFGAGSILHIDIIIIYILAALLHYSFKRC